MTEEAMPQATSLDRVSLALPTLTWERVAWLTIAALTLVTRLYDLGRRAMSHDESLHTYYSWKLYAGQGYQHDPMMHGPLLYHATALSYWLFGPNDMTARLFSVATGLLLVLSPLLLRKWLGKVGALAVGVMFLVSPTVMYYSRYIRHDIQVELFTVLMAVGFIRFLDSRANRWIVLAFAAASLGIASAEMTYINGFILVLFIVVALLVERLSPRRAGGLAIVLASVGLGLLVFASLADMGLLASAANFGEGRPKEIMQASFLFGGLGLVYGLTAALLAPFRSPAPDDDPAPGMTLADLVVGNVSTVLFFIGLAAVVGGGLLAGRSCGDAAAAPLVGTLSGCRLAAAVLAAGSVVLIYGALGWLLERYETRALAGSIGRARADGLLGGIGLAVLIYVLFYTTFFTNMPGIRGMVRSITYWIEQHDVVRGDQPWYYYGLLTPMYEFLPFFLALAAGWIYLRRWDVRVARGNDTGDVDAPSAAAAMFVPLFATWAAGAFWIYSWAGEKMPWLVVHLVVPLAFLAGRLVADTVDAVDWGALRGRAWQIIGMAALVVVAAFFLVVQTLSAGQVSELSRALAGLLLLGVCVWGLAYVARGVPRGQVKLLAALAFAVVLFLWNTRVSLVANFVNEELATEYIVYAHGTPDDKDVYDMLKGMQERLGTGRNLKIGYDNEVSWPFTWYFREDDWPETPRYLGESPSSAADLKNLDVILIGSPNYAKFEPYLRNDFVATEHTRMWWPNEGYKGYSVSREGWTRLVEQITNPDLRRNWLDILLYRKYVTDPRAESPEPKPLKDWYHHANMKVFVRSDLVATAFPDAATRPPGLEPGATSVLEAVPALTVPVDATFELGPADSPLSQPKGIDIDAAGNLWVVDHANERVVAFGSDGRALREVAAGDLVATGVDDQGQTSTQPSAWGVEVGPDGAVYIADTWNHKILKYQNGRKVLEFGAFDTPDAAKPLEKLGSFWGPRDVALDDEGNIYVADTGNKRIQVFDPTGTPITAHGGVGLEPGQFNEPTSIAFDPATGHFFVADLWNLRVQEFDRDFTPVRQWEVNGWDSQDAPFKAYIAVGPGGIVVASDPVAARVWVFGPGGETLGTLDLPMDDRGLKEPIGVDIDADGRIYVASSTSNVVTRYGPIQPVLDALTPAAGAEGADATGDGEAATGEGAADGAEPATPDDAAQLEPTSEAEPVEPGGPTVAAPGVSPQLPPVAP